MAEFYSYLPDLFDINDHKACLLNLRNLCLVNIYVLLCTRIKDNKVDHISIPPLQSPCGGWGEEHKDLHLSTFRQLEWSFVD